MPSHLSKNGKTFFLFVDESGDYNFSENGSRYFVMAGVGTFTPTSSASVMLDLKYELLSQGHGVTTFHASPDKQQTRKSVLESFRNLRNVYGHVVYGIKDQLDQHLRSDSTLHAYFALPLIEHFLKITSTIKYRNLVLIFDQALPPSRQREFRTRIKPILKDSGKIFHVYFQSMKFETNGQIADYIAWSKFKQLERGENRPWNLLSQSIRPTEMEINRGIEIWS